MSLILLSPSLQLDVPSVPKVRSRSKAAVEIQRHIRGYFARKKIGHLLAKRVENAVQQNDKQELKKVQSSQFCIQNNSLNKFKKKVFIGQINLFLDYVDIR